ncbi:MAG TPA: DinB family protein [Aggregatilineales bacterium]|nr:DinB family protein [Aggregatilineales bacterium]
MIQNISSFITYFESIRRRTLNYIQAIPTDRLMWSPKTGEFTCAELIRHIIATEALFVGVVVTGRWKYPGHESDPSDSLALLIEALNAGHSAAMESLAKMTDAVLMEPRPTLKSTPIKAWRVLMMMVEHEIHHRSQIAMYLTLMGVEPPQIYGMGVEDVIALATG